MKSLFTIPLFCLASLLASATQRTVNNNSNLPGNPGQFTTIQAAITASAAGDTILVAGTPNIYTFWYSGAITLTKRVVLLGPGYNPAKQNPLTAVISGGITINSTVPSGTVIMGFVISSEIGFGSGANVNNVTIRRNQFVSGGYISIADSTNHLLIAENIFTGQTIQLGTSKNQDSLMITNNIFTSVGSSGAIYAPESPATNYAPIFVLHNLFLSGTGATPLLSANINPLLGDPYGLYNMVIDNNIFYNVTAGPTNSETYYNFTFDNNITYSGTTLITLPLIGSVGSGNLNNTDPQMVSLFNTTSVTLDFNADNIRLQSGSPAINAATDHTNIGPTGGPYPVYVSTNQYLTGEPIIPEVKSANFIGASSTAPGGSLQIQVKAQKID